MKKSSLRDILEILAFVLVFLGIYYSLFTFVFSNDTVSGPSMQPNFETNDRVITVRHAAIHRGDIVVVKAPDKPGALYIKRVIGLPGESIRYKNDKLYVDNKYIPEKYLDKGKKLYSDGMLYTYNFTLKSRGFGDKVPKNSYFVMGDHRNVSNDSRMFGYVKRDQVIGVVKLRYWPLNKITWY